MSIGSCFTFEVGVLFRDVLVGVCTHSSGRIDIELEEDLVGVAEVVEVVGVVDVVEVVKGEDIPDGRSKNNGGGGDEGGDIRVRVTDRVGVYGVRGVGEVGVADRGVDTDRMDGVEGVEQPLLL